MKLSQLLSDARARVAEEKHWTRGAMARDKDGQRVGAFSNFAVSYCIMGALLRSAHHTDEYIACIEILDSVLPAGCEKVHEFNDNTTHEQILICFDKAIKRARKQGR